MSKEKRVTETPSHDSSFGSVDFSFGTSILALPDALKNYLTKLDMDWRFLNAQEFRNRGNVHRGHWQPFKAPKEASAEGMYGCNAEGLVQRGDLILGVRPKAITAKHKEHLADLRRPYSNFNKTEAQKMRRIAQESGLGNDVKVDEGYGNDED